MRALNGRGSHLLESAAVIAFGAAATTAGVICLLHTVERYKTVRHHIANIVRLLPRTVGALSAEDLCNKERHSILGKNLLVLGCHILVKPDVRTPLCKCGNCLKIASKLCTRAAP